MCIKIWLLVTLFDNKFVHMRYGNFQSGMESMNLYI